MPLQSSEGADGCMRPRCGSLDRLDRVTYHSSNRAPLRRLREVAIACFFGVCGLVTLPAGAAAADPPGTPLSREALAICHKAQATTTDTDARPLLDESLALADRAVASNPDDALAYFARFCALGEQARRSGASLSSLVKLWPIRDAIDRTLELAPDYPDALLGKGALLCSVPRLLGGDPTEGERLVRQALEVDPNYVGARLFLAERLLERDDRAAARVEAETARQAAERKNDPDAVRDADELLARIDATAAQRPGDANSSARRA